MKSIVVLLAAAACSFPAAAVFQTAGGYGATELYSTEGTFTTCGGLSLDGGRLYFGQGEQIQSMDVSGGGAVTVGTVEANTGNSFVFRRGGATWTSYTVGYFPNDTSVMGYLDAGGAFQSQLTMKGLWDAAVSPLGECYLVARPGESTGIYRYDWQTGAASLVADIGGYSGGLTFDSAGNLYYADQASGDILRFGAEQVQAGGLTAADGQSVLQGLFAGFIGFDDAGGFYATTGYGAAFSKYDLASGQKLADIAFGGVGQFAVDGETIYLIDTDWSTFSSTVQAVYAVPEPATLLLLSAGLMLFRKKR